MITKKDLAKAILELKESQAETDKQMKKTDEKLKSMGIHLGNISNNQGDIAEEFFYNSLENNPTLAGIDYDFIDKNVTRKKADIEDEYDILLVNGKDIAIIETKYKAHSKDIEKLIVVTKVTQYQKSPATDLTELTTLLGNARTLYKQ